MLFAAADGSDHLMKQALVEEKKAAVRAGEASIEKGKGKDLLSMVGEFCPPASCLPILSCLTRTSYLLQCERTWTLISRRASECLMPKVSSGLLPLMHL
jgi:hypothetical protein